MLNNIKTKLTSSENLEGGGESKLQGPRLQFKKSLMTLRFGISLGSLEFAREFKTSAVSLKMIFPIKLSSHTTSFVK